MARAMKIRREIFATMNSCPRPNGIVSAQCGLFIQEIRGRLQTGLTAAKEIRRDEISTEKTFVSLAAMALAMGSAVALPLRAQGRTLCG